MIQGAEYINIGSNLLVEFNV